MAKDILKDGLSISVFSAFDVAVSAIYFNHSRCELL